MRWANKPIRAAPLGFPSVVSRVIAFPTDLVRVKSNTFNVSDLREHIARPQELPPSAPQQPPPLFTDPDGVASYDIDQIIA